MRLNARRGLILGLKARLKCYDTCRHKTGLLCGSKRNQVFTQAKQGLLKISRNIILC